MSHHILIVDDDTSMRKMARVNLQKRGYSVDEAGDGIEALKAFKQQKPDLMLLDLTMPNMNGIDVCMWVRAHSTVPIVVLSAHDEEHLKVRALDAGADDYVTKPFSYAELLARVRANLRRSEDNHADAQQVVKIDDLIIDLGASRVSIGGQDVHLTQTEFTLLGELARKVDGVVPHAQLLSRAWGPEYRDANHYLYVYFGRIRKKMGDKYGNLIETIPRMGYSLRSTPQDAAAPIT